MPPPDNKRYLDIVPSGFEVEYDTTRIQELSKELSNSVESLLTAPHRTTQLWSNAWNAYSELAALTTFAELPSARALGLSIAEHHPAKDGSMEYLTSLIESIDSQLLIDLSLEQPQKGFGRTRTADEQRAILSSAGSRVILLSMGDTISGYFIFVSEPSPTALPEPNLLKDLAQRNLIESSNLKVGFLSSAGILTEARNALHNEGLWGGALLDRFMHSIGLSEKCHLYLATVRVGVNENPAKRIWQGLGLHATGYTIGDPNSKNRLEVLLRHASADRGFPLWFTAAINKRALMTEKLNNT